MKLCLVGSGIVPMPPKKGGAVELIEYEIARYMAKKREVHVIDISKERLEHGIEFHHINPKIPKNPILQRRAEYSFGKKAKKIVKEIKPDVVHLHTVFTALPFTFFRPESFLVYTSHNPAWTVPDRELDKANLLIKKAELRVMKKFDRVTAVSDTMKKEMVNKGVPEEKITVIKNFVDMKKFSPRNGRAWRKARGIDGPMVLFVGKMTENKGVGYIINAIPKILEKTVSTFVFVGPTSFETSELDKKWLHMVKNLGIEKNVIFTGAVTDNELPKIYSSADVFCLPTLREGLPVVILEALASGVSVVSTDVSGIPEVVNKNNGILVDRNSNDIAEAIIKLMKKPISREKVVNSVKNLEKEKIMKRYEKFYEALI